MNLQNFSADFGPQIVLQVRPNPGKYVLFRQGDLGSRHLALRAKVLVQRGGPPSVSITMSSSTRLGGFKGASSRPRRAPVADLGHRVTPG